MATFTVTNANDSGAGSLRQAVGDANETARSDTIVFDASFDGGAEDVIRLTGGQIRIREALTIDGGDGVTLTGDAAGDDVTDADGITDVAASGADLLDDNSRIFDALAELTLDGLTLTGGRTAADGASGGAVRATGELSVSNSTVSGNSTSGDNAHGGGLYAIGYPAEGGAIYSGYVTLTNSTVGGNSTAGFRAGGGGIYAFHGGVTVTNSTISGNTTRK